MASSRGGQMSDSSVQVVQIDGLVVLKLIKHCEEEGVGGSDLVQGVLLGLVEGTKLEVTNCFPIPRHGDDEEFDVEAYQMEMMRNLRHVNIDHLHVGWYQSTYFGSFLSRALLESQFNYQYSIRESVVLTYDHEKTCRGHLGLKALRLTQDMMDLYREGDFSPEAIKENGMSFNKMLEEVPIVIKNSHLVNAMVCELEEKTANADKYNFLDLATNSVLSQSIKLMMECVDEVCQENNKYFNHQRQFAKQKQAKDQYLVKRKQENKILTDRGDPPLPDEDINKIFKPIQAPPRLDSLILAGQIDNYTGQVTNFTKQSLGKLFLADSLSEEKPPSQIA